MIRPLVNEARLLLCGLCFRLPSGWPQMVTRKVGSSFEWSINGPMNQSRYSKRKGRSSMETKLELHEDLEKRFTYHAPKQGQPERYEKIRKEAKNLAIYIADECPNSREKSLALTKPEEAVFWANAAIARHE